MPRLLLIFDPIDGGVSVQYRLLESVARALVREWDVTVYTPYCDDSRADAIAGLGVELHSDRRNGFGVNRLLGRFERRNEAMLWAESWLREALFHRNAIEANRLVLRVPHDFVINLSMTVPVTSDLWWIQGTPLELTLKGMASTNLAARLADTLGGRTVASLDARTADRIRGGARRIVANSPFLVDFYRSRSVPVECALLTATTDFTRFSPASHPSRDFVLLYVGKDTDSIDLRSLNQAGVKIVGFGSKIPWATPMDQFTNWIDFRGRVSQEELVHLYSNALFTLFPFTFEPFGLVPIESMACGTPVLTYARQGPASTVVDGRTGWLVRSARDIVLKTRQLWRTRATGIDAASCVARARQFDFRESMTGLRRWVSAALDDRDAGMDLMLPRVGRYPTHRGVAGASG